MNEKEDKTKKLLKVPMGDELVPIKQEKKLEVLVNFKSKNKDVIQKVRENYLHEQEQNRIKYIELVNNEAKIREKNKMFHVRKQQKRQEMLLQPLDISEAGNEPLNPIREK